MWCPNCQNEFREGITICPECNIPLIESLEEAEAELKELMAVKDEALKDKIIKYLDHVNTPNSVTERINEEEETEFVISVPEEKAAETMQVIRAIIKVEAENKLKENPEEALKEAEQAMEQIKEMAAQKGFIKASDKSSDYTSSGWLFSVFGVALIVFAIINKLEVIRLFTATFSIIVLILMGSLFIVYGIYSIIKGKSLKGEVVKEEETETRLKAYIKENVTKEMLDALNDEDTSPELLYLKQSDLVKEKLMEAFPDTNDEYADMLVEEFMNGLYND
ncbi:MAG: hypothetical protein IJS80_00895 [Lachnospiraceae bacterium]|nr:hypothetical protein [Lachnospiraceae bacterium]